MALRGHNSFMQTKLQLHVVDGQPVIEEIPTNWILCSVSYEFRPPEEYMRDGVQCRTNCLRTYMMPMEEMNALKEKTQEIVLSSAYRAKYRELREIIERQELRKSSISIQDMIAKLQEIAQANPDARIVQRFGCMDSGDSYLDTPSFEMNPLGENIFVLGE